MSDTSQLAVAALVASYISVARPQSHAMPVPCRQPCSTHTRCVHTTHLPQP